MRLRRFDRYCVNFDPPRTSEQAAALALLRTVTTLSTCTAHGSWATRGRVVEPALGRRIALKMFGLGMAAGAAGLATLNNGTVSTAETALLLPAGKSLEKFTTRLSRAPRPSGLRDRADDPERSDPMGSC